MATIEHLIKGEGAPTMAPPAVGAHYIDTTGRKTYIATGRESAADWGEALATGATGGGGGAGGDVLPILAASGFQYAGQAAVQVDFAGIAGGATLGVPDLKAFDLLLTGANIDPDGRHLLIQGQGDALQSVWAPDASTLVTSAHEDGNVRIEVGKGEALYRVIRTGGTLNLYRLGEWPY
ncbi:hypothetical protein I5I61_21235 [Pseudomonas nitroreducens]|uniref:Phage tail protein n=1 Tax=Pseudomonas nitroreducens TaxID=46680 RepID=A0ABS0KPP3_PSENT|nr:hypothetical protein [Pseudomonas nitroreducens]MBG6289986.1 hypothetical protein [Pseudomonas nitroreducens]